MTEPILRVPAAIYREVSRHLLPPHGRYEEVAFLYVEPVAVGVFQHVDWAPVPPTGFVYRSSYGIELTDETRGGVIKRAHDLGASVVELHSHLGPFPAEFSPSDLAGFGEFVPHIFWRLKNRPYFAIVLTRSGFDGFAWLSDPRRPERIGGIEAGPALLKSTGLSDLRERGKGEAPFR